MLSISNQGQAVAGQMGSRTKRYDIYSCIEKMNNSIILKLNLARQGSRPLNVYLQHEQFQSYDLQPNTFHDMAPYHMLRYYMKQYNRKSPYYAYVIWRYQVLSVEITICKESIFGWN